MAAEWGELLPLCVHFYLILGKSWLILAVHYEVEMVEQIWPSTCQAVSTAGADQGDWVDFSHPRAGRAVKLSQQPWTRKQGGPQDIWSCQCQSILAEDGVTTRRIQASSLTSWLAERFPWELKDKLDLGS
jgi:hypothetical protein